MRAKLSALGILLILAGCAWNVRSVGWWLAPDQHLSSATHRKVVFALQALIACVGIGIALRGSKQRIGTRGFALSGLVLSAAVLAGGLGTLRSRKATAEKAPAEKGTRDRVHPPTLWELDEICAWIRESGEPHCGEGYLRRVQKALDEALSEGKPAAEVQVFRERVSRALLAAGDPERAVEQMEDALSLALTMDLDERQVNCVRFRLAVALLRKGEVDHCIRMHNPASCIFPISGTGVWRDASGARAAAEVLLEILRLDPEHLAARWLLNIANMTAGTYPEGVPDELLIPRSPAYATDEPSVIIPRFEDIASDLGVGSADCAGGALMDDVDGDGFLDIVSSSLQPCEPMHYFHNEGDGTFADWSERSRLQQQLGAFNVFQADYDEDGALDMLAVRGAWMGPVFGRQRDSLLHQEADGTFRDVTRESNLGAVAVPTSTAGWADYDLDGDLDAYLGIEGFPNQLYQNQGDGTFRELAADAGVASRKIAKGIAWGDADNDGDPDLYVSNLGQGNPFYVNRGDGTFAEAADPAGLGAPGIFMPAEPSKARYSQGRHGGQATFATWFFDYDNDGWLDLWVSGFDCTLGEVAADYLGLPASGERSRLYRNLGQGKFQDAADAAGVARVLTPMGSNYGDVNNDGFLDIYLGTGKPQFEWLVPNVLFVNVGGKRFIEATAASGLGHLQKGHGIAFGDLDNDGDQDVFAQMGGFFKADGFQDALFENPGTPNHWVTLSLRGVRANRDAIGARIRLDATGPEGERRIHAVVGCGGSFGSSSLQQEIGLGSAERIERIEIVWPGSGTRQVVEDVPIDCFVEITEASNEISVRERPRVRLAGSAVRAASGPALPGG